MLSSASGQWSVISGQGIRKLLFLLPIACCLVSSCGFKPVYGTASVLPEKSPIRAGVQVVAASGGVTGSSNNISIDESANRAIVRQFTQNMEDIIAETATPEYRLEVMLSQYIVGIGVARDGTAARYNLTINTNYKLIRLADNKMVDSGGISNVTSYNNPNNKYFSTYISEQDARKRGVREIAEMFRQRLIAYTDNIYPSTPPLSTRPPIDENCPEVC